MWRLFHWGPLIALFIIKCISLTTLYYTGLWLNITSSWLALSNHFVYYFLLASTLYNFLCSIFMGPGYVPKGWRPKFKSDEEYLQYCYQCEAFKAPRSHHCSKCQRCILKMDHHCPWINNCCGYNNQKFFFCFLLSAVIGSIHSSILLIITLYRALTFTPNENHKYIYLSLPGAFIIFISIGMSVGVILAVGFLLCLQAKIIVLNRTSIEDWIIKKAEIRKRADKFIYPYDLGIWKNVKQVLIEPLTAGVEWPVKKGCNQYTLTYEQIQQKKDKLENASLYHIIKPYNGRWFPLFSQGIKVCLSFPINDDPRLVVKSGDKILVTHSYKHWLYGRKINSKKKIHHKGWFPNQCAVLLVKQNVEIIHNSEHNDIHKNEDKIDSDNKKDK